MTERRYKGYYKGYAMPDAPVIRQALEDAGFSFHTDFSTDTGYTVYWWAWRGPANDWLEAEVGDDCVDRQECYADAIAHLSEYARAANRELTMD